MFHGFSFSLAPEERNAFGVFPLRLCVTAFSAQHKAENR